MRALTVRQPWAWAIAQGYKDIENRSWKPRLERGDVLAIHAARATPDWDDVQRVRKLIGRRGLVPEAFDCGCVVAVVRYDGTVEVSRSRWFGGPVGWLLGGAKALRSPVDCNGQLGLWTLPREIERRVRQRLHRRRVSGLRAAGRGGARNVVTDRAPRETACRRTT